MGALQGTNLERGSEQLTSSSHSGVEKKAVEREYDEQNVLVDEHEGEPSFSDSGLLTRVAIAALGEDVHRPLDDDSRDDHQNGGTPHSGHGNPSSHLHQNSFQSMPVQQGPITLPALLTRTDPAFSKLGIPSYFQEINHLRDPELCETVVFGWGKVAKALVGSNHDTSIEYAYKKAKDDSLNPSTRQGYRGQIPKGFINVVTFRTPERVEAFRAQDLLYSHHILGKDISRVIGSVAGAYCTQAPDGATAAEVEQRQNEVIKIVARPATKVVKMVLAHDGYCLNDSNKLDLTNKDVINDWQVLRARNLMYFKAEKKADQTFLSDPDVTTDENGQPITGPTVREVAARSLKTPIGFLLAGINVRRQAALEEGGRDQTPPLTVISYDNLKGNGDTLREAVVSMAHKVSDHVANHISNEKHVFFPNTLVDRIVPNFCPVRSQEDKQLVDKRLGFDDSSAIATERTWMHIVESTDDDDVSVFPHGVPLWARHDNVSLVSDIDQSTTSKILTVNGAHMALAWLGTRAGFGDTKEVFQGIDDMDQFLYGMLVSEICPNLLPLPLKKYKDHGDWKAMYAKEIVYDRLGNDQIPDELRRLNNDGMRKMKERVLRSVHKCLEKDIEFPRLALVVAAWAITVCPDEEANGHRPFLDKDEDCEDYSPIPIEDQEHVKKIMKHPNAEALIRSPEIMGDTIPNSDVALRAIDTAIEFLRYNSLKKDGFAEYDRFLKEKKTDGQHMDQQED